MTAERAPDRWSRVPAEVAAHGDLSKVDLPAAMSCLRRRPASGMDMTV